MESGAHWRRVHAAVTALLGGGVLLLVVLTAIGLVEIRYTGRLKATASSDPSASGPQIVRVGADLDLEDFATPVSVHFRYSGTLIDCWLEVETDGQKTVVVEHRSRPPTGGDSSQEPKRGTWGFVHLIERLERQGDQERYVWNLTVSDDRGSKTCYPGFKIPGVVLLHDSNSAELCSRDSIGAAKLTGEIRLWERSIYDSTRERKCRQAIRLKCRPAVAGH